MLYKVNAYEHQLKNVNGYGRRTQSERFVKLSQQT